MTNPRGLPMPDDRPERDRGEPDDGEEPWDGDVAAERDRARHLVPEADT